jgi:predicted DNA-binding transcriptional regulator AlpA
MNPATNHTPHWPRGLRRTLAAAYIGVGQNLFDAMVAEGSMPKPKRIHGRTIWDKVAVDRAFDLLDGGLPRDDSGEEIVEWSSKPPKSSAASTETLPAQQRPLFGFQIRQQKWERSVPRYKFSTKETIALRSLIENGGEAQISQMQLGAGVVALQMLALRKYALLVGGDPNDFRTLRYQVTEAGRLKWTKLTKQDGS